MYIKNCLFPRQRAHRRWASAIFVVIVTACTFPACEKPEEEQQKEIKSFTMHTASYFEGARVKFLTLLPISFP